MDPSSEKNAGLPGAEARSSSEALYPGQADSPKKPSGIALLLASMLSSLLCGGQGGKTQCKGLVEVKRVESWRGSFVYYTLTCH